MKVLEIVKSLLPVGTDGTDLEHRDGVKIPSSINYERCPIWPPDIFAVTATLIERSGCYTEAGPPRSNPGLHVAFLNEVSAIVRGWVSQIQGLFHTPERVSELWQTIVLKFGETQINDVIKNEELVSALLLLFALADEACKGVGWDTAGNRDINVFADLALVTFVTGEKRSSKHIPRLPYAPNSICALVPPYAAIVMPKTLTATVGCSLRSLSHHLALLPGMTQCLPEWALTNELDSGTAYKPIRLLIIPFPYSLPSESFSTSGEPQHLIDGNFTAAYFGLAQLWLSPSNKRSVTAEMLFSEVVNPLYIQACKEGPVTGIVMPECALSLPLANALADSLKGIGLSFFTTGILVEDAAAGKCRNIAKTYILHPTKKNVETIELEQSKHHRWRLDRSQCEQYGLDFHRTSIAEKWWEDIDVSNRQLPFFAFRRDMSMTVLICEDLARNDPAMSVVRAIGPNLVIALLMDGPQLRDRWPGRYATVLGEDPGSGVLSVTCAAMVDRSNSSWKKANPTNQETGDRIIGLWRSEGAATQQINLPANSHAVLLTIHSDLIHQHTLDNRSDDNGSRKLSLGDSIPVTLANPPYWL